jgi:ribosomal protein S18 acetylase RimI-like enzyme
MGMSTFACKPLINIHDLYVDTVARGQGTGQGLLEFVQARARERGCCKVTLEVLSGNTKALEAYIRFGFEHYTLDDKTGNALFMHKSV